MKLGIITFHRAINYGAALQAFALQDILNKKGYETEIIDYACERLENCYKKFYNPEHSLKGFISAIIYYPIRSARIEKFANFRKKYMHISDEKNITKDKLKKIANKYDYIITGSDQVWNPEQTDYDMSYFLDFVKPEKRISYAASMGTNKPTEKQAIILKKYVQSYHKISVREEENEKYLTELLNIKVETVADPVFLVSADEWKLLIDDQPIINEPYIFVYCLHEKMSYKYAEYLSNKTGKKIVSIPDSIRVKCSGKKDFKAGVLEFLNYIFYADYVITDSFHATAFSLIFEKQFNIIMKQNKKELNGRLYSISNKYNLNEIVISNSQDINKIGKEISFDKIRRIKEKEIAEAEQFINSFGDQL